MIFRNFFKRLFSCFFKKTNKVQKDLVTAPVKQQIHKEIPYDPDDAKPPLMKPKEGYREPNMFNSPIHIDFYRRQEKWIKQDKKQWINSNHPKLKI